MTPSTSKIGRHIGGGAGQPFAPPDRFAKTLDIGALSLAAAQSPGTLWIWREVREDQGQLLSEGRAGGERLAREQLARIRALGLAQTVRYIEGLNEVVGTGNSHVAAVQFAYGHAAQILAAGYVPIELNIQVGNVELADLERDDYALARFLQWSWSRAVPVGYHAYWDYRGPDADWLHLAGRYQTIAALAHALRVDGRPGGAAIVTAPALWAITECGIEVTGTPGSGPVWEMVRRGRLTEAQAVQQYMRAYRMFNLDTQVVFAVGFSWWHRFDPAWADYDLAVAPNGQPWGLYLEAHAAHLAQPGLVVNPPGAPVQPPPPPAPTFPRTVYALGTGAPAYVNLRAAPSLQARDLADVPRGTALEVTEERAGFYRVEAWVAASVTSPTPPGGAKDAGE